MPLSSFSPRTRTFGAETPKHYPNYIFKLLWISVAKLSAGCDSTEMALYSDHFLSFYSFRNPILLYMWVGVSNCSLVCMPHVIRCRERTQRSDTSGYRTLQLCLSRGTSLSVFASISANMKNLFITEPFTTSPIRPFFFSRHTHLDR